MGKYCLVLTLFLSSYLFGQENELENLKMVREKLLLKKEIISDSISIINEKIKILNEFYLKNNSNTEYTIVKAKWNGKIREKPEIESKIINQYSSKDSIRIYGYIDGYWLVEKNFQKGYSNEMDFVKNPFMEELIKKHILEKDNTIKNSLVEKENKIKARKKQLISKYGQLIGLKIFERKIWIGMTEEMLVDSLGEPYDINRTVTKNSVNKQFIYKSEYNPANISAYIYVENGIVTSWQD